MKQFKTWEDVLTAYPSGSNTPKKETTDRIYTATRLEDAIYKDLRKDNEDMDETEHVATEKLSTFPALSRDVYQSLYAIHPKKNPVENLSTMAQKCNQQLMQQVVNHQDYPALKQICEGKELPAMEASQEFLSNLAEDLDGLLGDLDVGSVKTLDKLKNAKYKAEKQLEEALSRPDSSNAGMKLANQVAAKQQQVEAVNQLVDTHQAKQSKAIATKISNSVSAATQKAQEVCHILGAWSDTPGNMEITPANLDCIRKIRQSHALLDISKYLGRFRELFAKGRKNGYAYGRGETYSLALGNTISKTLTSELAMLATPQTAPLFFRKYQQKQLKQYERREPITKGMGDMICCLDESGSTVGDCAAWGKAVALTLLEIAMETNRKFALIHFADHNTFRTDFFHPGACTMAQKLQTAETFLGGGTDYETPLLEAIRLIEQEGFDHADITFLTDGACELPADFAQTLQTAKSNHKFTITGILLDANQGGFPFSLERFCEKIYRTSQLTGESIIASLISQT